MQKKTKWINTKPQKMQKTEKHYTNNITKLKKIEMETFAFFVIIVEPI